MTTSITRDVGATELTAIEQVVDRLRSRYPDVSPETVSTVVQLNYARFDGRPLRDFVPLFVERGARRELAALS